MIVMVSVVGLGPVVGTAIGAAVGAVTNFSLGRNYTFRATARDRGVHGQFIRYVVVSAASLGWNALGVHFVAVQLAVQYVLARFIVGTLVGFVWNFPMHRYFVFRP
jgi:putative flippase GtrA